MRWLVLILTGGLLIGCMADEIPVQKTYRKKGLVYRKGEAQPFSGIVYGTSREGYRDELCFYKKRYVDGQLNGLTKFWYDNGKLESQEPYKNGKINGLVYRYRKDGRRRCVMHLVDGRRGGSAGEYFFR